MKRIQQSPLEFLFMVVSLVVLFSPFVAPMPWTNNTALTWANAMIAASTIYLAAMYLYQAANRKSIRQWPVTALVALAGPHVMFGAIFLQLWLFRLYGLTSVRPVGMYIDSPLGAFGVYGDGTVFLRQLLVVVLIGKIYRVQQDRLLTPRDRIRIAAQNATYDARSKALDVRAGAQAVVATEQAETGHVLSQRGADMDIRGERQDERGRQLTERESHRDEERNAQ